MSSLAAWIRSVTSGLIYHPDGTQTTMKSPAVWTLAHRGYSGGGRLDVWVYPTKKAALQAGADLALQCGMDQDDKTMTLYRAGRFETVLERYEELSRPSHVLRVQAAFLQLDEAEAEQYTTVKRTMQRRRGQSLCVDQGTFPWRRGSDDAPLGVPAGELRGEDVEARSRRAR